MPDLTKIYLYRMTHVKNIQHILEHGITHIVSPNKNPDYVPIGDGRLINSRNNFRLPNRRTLGEYIPFYFGGRMPMLYVIQHGYNGVNIAGPHDIVYCITSIAAIEACGMEYIFTDGHAVDGLSSFYLSSDLENIENVVDFKAVNISNWIDEKDLDLKRRKEAEFLVLGDVPATAILGFIVYDDETKNQIIQLSGNEMKIIVRPNYYF